MSVSRQGYYKWKNRGKPAYEDKRTQVLAFVTEIHAQHPSHGYRWVAAYIQINYQVKFSDNYVYKAFRYLGIKSETRHKEHPRQRKEKDKFPNLIYTTWDTVDRPRQVIVSDMTAFRFRWFYFEVTFYFDVFTKQILTWKAGDRRGDRNQYIGGLEDVVTLLRGCKAPTILHTDQGSVYASVAYNDLISETCIQRSMSRAGKPTDNPVNESLNGWIKEELFTDFHMDDCRNREDVLATLKNYVDFYNKQRPSYAIGYDTPDNYYRRFMRGEIQKKDTFSGRILTTEPKFIQRRKADKAKNVENTVSLGDVSTPEKEKH
jgi:transposase InsO family protein